MKKKNGFSLFGLLLVIVIVALIAFILIPINTNMNIINDTKKSVARDMVYGYIRAIEYDAAKDMITNQDLLTGNYTTKSGDLYSENTKVLSVSFKGTRPVDGGKVTMDNGRVVKAEFTFGGNSFIYDGNTIKE